MRMGRLADPPIIPTAATRLFVPLPPSQKRPHIDTEQLRRPLTAQLPVLIPAVHIVKFQHPQALLHCPFDLHRGPLLGQKGNHRTIH